MKTLAFALVTGLIFTASASALTPFLEDFTAQTTGASPSGTHWTVTPGTGTTANVIDIGGSHGHVWEWADNVSDATITARLQSLPANTAASISWDMYIPNGELNGDYFDMSLVTSSQPDWLPLLNIHFYRAAHSPATANVSFQAGYGGDRPMIYTLPNDDTWYTFTIAWGSYSGINPIVTLSVALTGGSTIYTGSPWTNIYATGAAQTPNRMLFSPISNANKMNGVLFDNFAIPEPASLGLLGLGALMFVHRRRA